MSKLPVSSLSASSVSLYIKCPEKWRRRYIENEWEPAGGAMIAGGAFAAATSTEYRHRIDEDPISIDDVLDAYTDEWHHRVESTDVEWGSDRPEKVRESGQLALEHHQKFLAPTIQPVTVERQFEVTFDGVDWKFKGYIDLERQTEHGLVVADTKLSGRKLSKGTADVDIQATAYMLARRAEGNPSPKFEFHVTTRTAKPAVEVVQTSRTDVQLDSFTRRLFTIASEIEWRLENDHWQGAVPGTWWCSEKWCGFWDSCEFGGLR